MASPNPEGDFRSGTVSRPASRRDYPAYETLAGLSPYSNTHVFWRVPWLRPNGLDDEGLVESYVVANELPDGLPARAVATRDWQYHCYIPDNLVNRRVGQRRVPLPQARQALTRAIYQRIQRMGIEYPVEPEHGFDTWMYRSYEEARSGIALREVLKSFEDRVNEWEPRQEALSYRVTRLPPGFKTCHRFATHGGGDCYYRLCLRFERYQRGRSGYFVPYQALEVQHLKRDALRARYVALPAGWPRWEVPRGLHVELPSVLTYAWSKLINQPSSGIWSVFYTEWCTNVAIAWLWEIFSSGRLFWLPNAVQSGLKALNLEAVLGSADIQQEATKYLALCISINWKAVHASQRSRPFPVSRSDFARTMREDSGGDWVYVDTETCQVCDEAQALSVRDARWAAARESEDPAPSPQENVEMTPADNGDPDGDVSLGEYEEEIPEPRKARRSGAESSSRSESSNISSVARRAFGQLDLAAGLENDSSDRTGPSGKAVKPAMTAEQSSLALMGNLLKSHGLASGGDPKSIEDINALLAQLARSQQGKAGPSGSASTLGRVGVIPPKPIQASGPTAGPAIAPRAQGVSPILPKGVPPIKPVSGLATTPVPEKAVPKPVGANKPVAAEKPAAKPKAATVKPVQADTTVSKPKTATSVVTRSAAAAAEKEGPKNPKPGTASGAGTNPKPTGETTESDPVKSSTASRSDSPSD